MERLFTISWFVWAPVCAWLSRYIVVRTLQKRLGRAAYVVAYGVWFFLLIVGAVFVNWTGLQLYGFDRSDPWQMAGWAVLTFSPFGLPTLVGAPIIFVVDMIRFAFSSRNEAKRAS